MLALLHEKPDAPWTLERLADDAAMSRSALADHELPAIELDDLGKWDPVRTEGDKSRWDVASGAKEYTAELSTARAD
ncbi:MAG: hypothetical protein LAO51_13485 [Acidobacteriia bacterium]|nr:hypothetical protein [Terriglobia bacterium]